MDKNELRQKVKLAEQFESYHDMAACIKSVTKQEAELSTKEKNLLSLCCLLKCHRGPKVILESHFKYRTKDRKCWGKNQQIIQEYREKIETKLRDICNDTLSLLEKFLICNALQAESKVFLFENERRPPSPVGHILKNVLANLVVT